MKFFYALLIASILSSTPAQASRKKLALTLATLFYSYMDSTADAKPVVLRFAPPQITPPNDMLANSTLTNDTLANTTMVNDTLTNDTWTNSTLTDDRNGTDTHLIFWIDRGEGGSEIITEEMQNSVAFACSGEFMEPIGRNYSLKTVKQFEYPYPLKPLILSQFCNSPGGENQLNLKTHNNQMIQIEMPDCNATNEVTKQENNINQCIYEAANKIAQVYQAGKTAQSSSNNIPNNYLLRLQQKENDGFAVGLVSGSFFVGIPYTIIIVYLCSREPRAHDRERNVELNLLPPQGNNPALAH